jgi:micrococcal nuclease
LYNKNIGADIMYQYNAVVERVVDGDTIVCNVDLGFNIFVKEKFRLAKINAPEMNTTDGIVSKTILEEKILGKKVILQSEKQDKYGRWLTTISLDGLEINQWLLDNKYAVLYKN